MNKIKKILLSRIFIVSVLILIQSIWFITFMLNLTSESWWIQIVLQVMSFIALFLVINRNDNPAYKLAWSIPILLFPIFGGLLYGMLGGKKPARRMRTQIDTSWNRFSQEIKQDEEVLNTIEGLDKKVRGQVGYIVNNSGYPVYKNTNVKYYESGEENFPDMLEALRSAKKFIFVEYFIIGEGRMWNEILEILKGKAMSGVDVRLIYDDFGCLTLLPYKYGEELAKYNIKCVVFNPVKPIISAVMNHRDHRKIMVIDGNIGFTGGLNLADEYINEKDRFGYWKDTGVRLIGDAVYGLTAMFLTTWNAFYSTNDTLGNFAPELSLYQEMLDKEKQNDSLGFVQPYADSPLDEESVGENVYLNIINMAENYVYICTPYLIIDNEMMTALCLASKRGVDVRIITPNIPDKKMVFAVTQSYYVQLVKAGIKVYQFEPGFLHAKSFVCDDEIATVGTINMDYRSLYLHFECGVYMYRNNTICDIKEDFIKTMNQSIQMTEDKIKRKLPMRLFQSILRLLAPMM
ncbi:cardiolipin synthase [Lachnoclostridium phytofermentans]|uniref:Cardiolipin synthase n=1 Tax=Lachnoclostridium phytofermentans (strain ATCC 700394 / DSM 18823 / ISDg) TaxID=357809 RepID=A9KLS4_LACP7|nr:cardiolipin synthase [Lachnoclostridium phytofermentans]ABX42818.1 phospholipase D/Transphosphatidylase [Lachnoclostridium phytofermentans ISDg]